MKSVFCINALALSALFVSVINAHGLISQPKATFKDPATATSYNAKITDSVNPAFQGKKWDDNPQANARTFTAAFAQSGYKSLREMLDPAAPDCGNSRTDVDPINVAGMSTMKFQNDFERKGFVDSHHGPCEVWIDDTKLWHEDDCVAKFHGYPAEMPVDYSACKSGKCTLTFYWLALHEPQWQVYKQCVPITNGAKQGESYSAPAPGPTSSTPRPSTDSYSTPAPYNNNNNNNNNPGPAPAPRPYSTPAPGPNNNNRSPAMTPCSGRNKNKSGKGSKNGKGGSGYEPWRQSQRGNVKPADYSNDNSNW